MEPIPLHYVTMTNYDDSFQGVHVIYDKPNLVGTLGEMTAAASPPKCASPKRKSTPTSRSSSVAAAKPFDGERRLIPQPQIPTYDLQPEIRP